MSRRAEAVRKLYEELRQGLYSHALVLTGDRAKAEDAVHAAIEKLMARPFMPLNPKLYLYRCVRNAAISAWRKNEARRNPYFDIDARAELTADHQRAERLEAALERLSQDEREIVTLKVFDELTFREIAALRGANANTTASHYRRGIEKLRELCAEEPT